MRFSSATDRSSRSSGFTLIEVLIIAPIVIIAISGFVALMIITVGDVLVTRDQTAATYSAQEALDTIEQDVRLSADFLTTTDALPSPQGRNNNFTGTSAFVSTDPDTLLLNTITTDENPTNSSRAVLYYANQPNPCGSLQSYNRPFLTKVIYFVKDNSLWRRTYVPDYNLNTTPDANTICTTASYPPWPQNSCSPGQTATRCKTDDAKLADNVTSLNIKYYNTPGGTTDLGAGNAPNATTVEVTITGSKTTAGRSIDINASRRATKLNEVAANQAIGSVTLKNGWENYPFTTGHPAGATKTSNKIVFLTGQIRNGSTTSGTVIGTLLPGYRPSERLAFRASTQAAGSSTATVSSHARIDVLPNGDIVFMSGSTNSASATWLDGIYFVASDATYTWSAPTSFANGWSNYTAQPAPTFSTLQSARDSVGRVHLKGVVKPGTVTEGTTIANLATANQSADYLNFSSTSSSAFNSFGTRTTYGVRARGISSTWMSIQAMYYPGSVGSWTNLSLTNSWITYSVDYATPAYTKASDGVVTIRGRMKGGTISNGTIFATLPAGYRPSRATTFSVVAYDDTYCRVDVLSSGSLMLRNGCSASWVSLDGISFVATQ